MDYAQTAKEARLKVLDLIFKAQTSHIGSNFSCIDILTVLFEKIDLDKDKFVLSAGWKAASFYYFLWKKGRITEEELNSYCQGDSKWIGLSEPIHPDIPIAGGSMGLGLPGAVGLALAKKLKGEDGIVYCLMSDGELQVGTTWESAQIASHHKLNNLVVIVDVNGLQAMGKTDSILKRTVDMFFGHTRPEPNPFPHPHSGGWNYGNIDGHWHKEIDLYLFYDGATEQYLDKRGNGQTKPLVIFAYTTKGKGVSFMENNNLFHYKAPSKEEFEEALKELQFYV